MRCNGSEFVATLTCSPVAFLSLSFPADGCCLTTRADLSSPSCI